MGDSSYDADSVCHKLCTLHTAANGAIALVDHTLLAAGDEVHEASKARSGSSLKHPTSGF